MATDNNSDIYTSMLQPRGPAYRQNQINKKLSHYNDPIDHSAGRAVGNSHIVGDASPATQSRAIDALIASGERAGLQPREIAYVLAIAQHESGFNPDAAAGTSSAYGLGQLLNETAAEYGVNDINRSNLRMQADTLVAHYQHNAAIAREKDQGAEYIYKHHHDGKNGESGGLAISQKKVMPHLDAYEKFVREHQQKYGIEPLAPSMAHRMNAPEHHGEILRQGSRGPAVTGLQTQLQALGYLPHADDHGKPLPLGTFGPVTLQAVKAFQRDHHLTPVDGAAGSHTLNKLHELTGQQQRQAMPGQPAQRPQPEPAAPHTNAQPDKNNVRQEKEAFGTGDPDLDRLAEALFSSDRAATSRAYAHIAQSPEVRAMVQQGHEFLAMQRREEQQQQQAMRQSRGRSLSR